MQKDKAILLVRGAKPLLLKKITPEEHPSFKKLKYCKSTEYVPCWRQSATIAQSEGTKVQSKSNPQKESKVKKEKREKLPQYQVQIPIADKVSEEYVPSEEETNLNPTVDITSNQINCRTLGEIGVKEEYK